MAQANQADQQRARSLYHYLCACLAMKRKPDGTPHYQGISDRLGDRDLRKAVSYLFQEGQAGETTALNFAKLKAVTTGTVVATLIKLRNSLATDYQKHDERYTRVLTQEDVLSVLYRLVELTPKERKNLGLQPGDGLTLLQRALLILQTAGGISNYEMLLRIYKAAVGLDFSQGGTTLNTLAQVDDLIEATVRQTLEYLPNRRNRSRNTEPISRGREETIIELTRKAQREIRRLMARSGNQQSLVSGSATVDSYICHYLQSAFVGKLAQSVVANERLTDQFPVYLKRLTMEASGPLPFADRELGILQAEGHYPALLHPDLRRLDQGFNPLERFGDLPGPGDYELASQEATRVVAEFYVKVPEGHHPVVRRVFRRLASGNQLRMDFSLESTGIGGSLSHIIKVINTALLADIACLREYFPIAHDVACTQEIIRDNVPSPVWAHSLVKLCRKETVAEAIRAGDRHPLSSYEEFAFANPIGHGDYCGFDFLLSQAQAALQARLQAIRNAGIASEEYIRHLCQRTEYAMALKDAWSYLRGYPFSSLAMVGAIEEEILVPNVGDRPLSKQDPYIYFDACLSIIEALLDEGAYRPARRYLERLEVLREFVQQGLGVAQTAIAANGSTFEVFSGALIIRYLLCLANYYYLYDTENRDGRYLPPDCDADINREGLIRRAWNTLDQAQHHVAVRLRKYVVINEVSQGTFHPHYCLLARIAFLRAKMLLFFPRYVPKDDHYLPTERFTGQRRTEASIHWGRLYLAEKARLYAAADGDSEIYACYAAIQCWFHLMAAYADGENLYLPSSPGAESTTSGAKLTVAKCFEWAKKLRDHALISYADTGRQCYYQIKEKSGLPEEFDEFGRYCIQKLPAIYEARGTTYEQLRQTEHQVLILDMSLLAVNVDDLPKLSPNHPTRNIYLFGTNACYLFFARGMYLLCSNVSSEFESLENPTQPIQWGSKLYQAMRLLNMAWAIAEEGADIEKEPGREPEQEAGQDPTQPPGQDSKLYITRPFKPTPGSNEYVSQEILFVRDLYPRRVTEIADLGKVFAAACMVLRLHTVPLEEQARLTQDLNHLLGTLNSAHRLSSTLRAILARQPRFNGHLQAYLSRSRGILMRHAAIAQTAPANPDLRHCRDALVKELFTTLLG